METRCYIKKTVSDKKSNFPFFPPQGEMADEYGKTFARRTRRPNNRWATQDDVIVSRGANHTFGYENDKYIIYVNFEIE